MAVKNKPLIPTGSQEAPKKAGLPPIQTGPKEAVVEKKTFGQKPGLFGKREGDDTLIMEGDLIMERDMVFDRSIRVKGKILGKDGKQYNLTVKGTIDAWDDIDARNITAGQKIDTRGNLTATEDITLEGDIDARNMTARHITANGDITVQLNITATSMNAGGNITASGGIRAEEDIRAGGNIYAMDIHGRNIDAWSITAGDIHASGNLVCEERNKITYNAKTEVAGVFITGRSKQKADV